MIGFLLEQALRNQLPDRTIATLLTSVLVDRDDPALTRPTKFVGPVYSHVEAGALATTQGWSFARDGEKLRRVVPSPDPRSILEIEAVRVLIEAGVLVICGGGGGVPVVRHDGRIEGVEGVVDKDLTSALLAERIHAERLLLLTDVSGVMRGWNTPRVQTIRQVAVSELRAAQLPAGSMGPKAEAACRFVEHTGKTAVIGALSDAAAMLAGEAGTVVVP
jgi:carbamate kinase